MPDVILIPVKGSIQPAIVDATDAPGLLGKPWRAMRKKGGTTYAVYDVRVGRKVSKVLMHRCVLSVDAGMQVDHRNRNGLDNRRSNLRPATCSQNLANVPGRGMTSKFRGVYWDQAREMWRARLEHDGKRYHLGRHSSEESAARAYNEKALEVWGEFALLNQF